MARLSAIREKLNLTQEELTERSGISIRTIQRIEAGTAPKGYTLKTLAKALDVQENELLEEENISDEENFTWLKLVNLSSLLVTLLPPANIILPLVLMFVKKQFTPLAKQIVSIQILWTILAAIVYVLTAFMKVWFSLGDKFVLCVLILAVLVNVAIILKNAASLDKYRTLSVDPGFSII